MFSFVLLYDQLFHCFFVVFRFCWGNDFRGLFWLRCRKRIGLFGRGSYVGLRRLGFLFSCRFDRRSSDGLRCNWRSLFGWLNISRYRSFGLNWLCDGSWDLYRSRSWFSTLCLWISSSHWRISCSNNWLLICLWLINWLSIILCNNRSIRISSDRICIHVWRLSTSCLWLRLLLNTCRNRFLNISSFRR